MNYIAICANSLRSVTNAVQGKKKDDVYIVLDADVVAPEYCNIVKNIEAAKGDIDGKVKKLQARLQNVTIIDERNVVGHDSELVVPVGKTKEVEEPAAV